MAAHLISNCNALSWLNFLLLLLNMRALLGHAVSVAELNDPQPNWVSNTDGILNLESEVYINEMVSKIHIEACKYQCVNMRVVAIDKMEGSRQDIDEFAINVFDKWQLGKHGILIIIAVGDRKITAKINPGALSFVSSNDAKNAREKIHHHLKEDRWDEGMKGLIKNYHTIVMSKKHDAPGTIASILEIIKIIAFCVIFGLGARGDHAGDDGDDGAYDCDDGGGDSADF